uniref:MAM domain-containing protein n=1 Tax=Heterorhabditis bacteriophora TaxID=37862 RepID=A0A1I7WN77_HETBA
MGEISSSSDMNCDFTTSCRWRNATGPEDNGEWMHSAKLDIDPIHHIIPMKEGDGENFIYSSGLMGQTVSLLVSDVVTCQLGGANIKYWYFKTGHESRLEVCIREPPGSKDTASMRCYDGLSSTFAQQWIFRIIELPPISQPFEIIFRATFFPPADVIALDDISYDATLCGHRKRRNRSTPKLIGYRDWEEFRQSEYYRGQTMIIVAQNTVPQAKIFSTSQNPTIDRTEQISSLRIENSTSSTLNTTSQILVSSTPISTTLMTINTTTLRPFLSTDMRLSQDINISTTEASTESVSIVTTTYPHIQEDPLSNFMKLLRQTAPVLPYIPILVRTLQSVDPRIQQVTGKGPLDELSAFTKPAGIDLGSLVDVSEFRRAPVQASHFYNTETPVMSAFPLSTEESLAQMAKKFGLLDDNDLKTTLIPPSTSMYVTRTKVNRNAFSIFTTTTRPTTILPTVYPAKLLRNHLSENAFPIKNKLTHENRTGVKLSQNEIRKLSKIHSGIFNNEKEQSSASPIISSTTELMVFKKPTKSESDVALKLTELAKYLPEDAMADLSALREIPDLEGLTKGMDLSLIRKPGGFLKLKKQFIERLMRRTLEISHSDVNQGAGGKFGSEESNPTLVDFNDGSVYIYMYNLSRNNHYEFLAGSFIYAGGHTVSPKDTFILSTNIPFELKEQSQLDFFVYHADARKWKNYHVFLTTAVHAIHFVADGLADNYALGLDQIQILNKYGMAANKC